MKRKGQVKHLWVSQSLCDLAAEPRSCLSVKEQRSL